MVSQGQTQGKDSCSGLQLEDEGQGGDTVSPKKSREVEVYYITLSPLMLTQKICPVRAEPSFQCRLPPAPLENGGILTTAASFLLSWCLANLINLQLIQDNSPPTFSAVLLDSEEKLKGEGPGSSLA